MRCQHLQIEEVHLGTPSRWVIDSGFWYSSEPPWDIQGLPESWRSCWYCSTGAIPMIYCYEHWLVKPHGWKSMLCYTLLPMPPGLMKRCWRGRKKGEMKSFVLVFVSLFYFALVWFYIFSFFFGGAVDTMGGYGGTMRWAELGFIMWNSQRISQEFILKTSK